MPEFIVCLQDLLAKAVIHGIWLFEFHQLEVNKLITLYQCDRSAAQTAALECIVLKHHEPTKWYLVGTKKNVEDHEVIHLKTTHNFPGQY